MEWCKNILDKAGDKYLVTPLRTDRQHRNFRHWKKAITIDGNEYLVNTRAGSNCWMMKRSQYDHIGRFSQHRKAGSQWNNAFQDRGYLVVTKETDPLAKDAGFKRGYDLNAEIPHFEL